MRWMRPERCSSRLGFHANSGGEDGDANPLPPLPAWKSGGQRVDISNREELYGVMEGECTAGRNRCWPDYPGLGPEGAGV